MACLGSRFSLKGFNIKDLGEKNCEKDNDHYSPQTP
jgi:hypothetical protein